MDFLLYLPLFVSIISGGNVSKDPNRTAVTPNDMHVSRVVTPLPRREQRPESVTTEAYLEFLTPIPPEEHDDDISHDKFNAHQKTGSGERRKLKRQEMRSLEDRISAALKGIAQIKIQHKNKLTVFFAGYLFYPLFELFWIIRGYQIGDHRMMERHIARYMALHLQAFNLVVYALRMPIVFFYLILLIGHQFLCQLLLSEVPKQLFPKNLTRGQKIILISYCMLYKGVGYLVSLLGNIQVYLDPKIRDLQQLYRT